MYCTTIVKLAIAMAIGFLSFGTVASPTKRAVRAVQTMASLHIDAAGFVQVASDGVARSYASDGTTVIDYIQLTPAALSTFVATLPPTMSTEKKAEIKNALAGVDGFDTDNTQLVNPPASLRPATATDEQFVSANEAFVANKKLAISQVFQKLKYFRNGTDICVTSGGLPACVGKPCSSNAACGECNKCMAPIGEHTVVKWCHSLWFTMVI